MSQRRFRHVVLAGVSLSAALAGSAQTVSAQGGKLEARYAATLAGVPIGSGVWHINVSEDQFTAAVSGSTSGLMSVFSTGKGTSASRGSVTGGLLSPTAYSSSISTDRKYDEVRLQLNSGTVKDAVVEPPTTPDARRVPIQDAHRRGVLDPLTASIMRVPGNGGTFVPQACNRKLAIFDGRMRYDLQLTYKRLEKVKSVRGYQGAVVVCGTQFKPVAGHVPNRTAIKYLAELRDTEMWLAPIAGTRFMVPYRISLTTPLGKGVVQATHFVTVPQTPQPTPISVRPSH